MATVLCIGESQGKLEAFYFPLPLYARDQSPILAAGNPRSTRFTRGAAADSESALCAHVGGGIGSG